MAGVFDIDIDSVHDDVDGDSEDDITIEVGRGHVTLGKAPESHTHTLNLTFVVAGAVRCSPQHQRHHGVSTADVILPFTTNFELARIARRHIYHTYIFQKL